MLDFSRYKSQIESACLSNNVRSLFVFGSAVSDKFSDTSDIDLVVDIDDNDPIAYSDHYFNLKFRLSEILNRDIDLLENKKISNPFLKSEIDKTKQLVYAK